MISTCPSCDPPATDVAGVRWWDRPVDEPDFASWAWHRATGAAVAVLVATGLGLFVGAGFGAATAGPSAAAVVYGVGPGLALLERPALRRAPVTPRRLRRFWIAAALVTVALPAVALDGGIIVTLYGSPIAVVAAWGGVRAGLVWSPRVGRPFAVLLPAALVATVAVAAGATLIDGVLMLALLVVVPTGASLVPGAPIATPVLFLAAGVPATAALLLDAGDIAGALVLPWHLVTATGAVLATWGWWTSDRCARGLLWPLAAGYLAFGGLWLLADRAGYEFAGFGPPLVQLTAVHFAYAGFVATVLAGCAWSRRPDDRLAATAAIAIAGAPPLVAIGFAAVGALQVVGAVLLTVGTYALAWVTLRHVVWTVRPLAAWTLGASAVSVLVPMALAVQWAVGANLGTPALSIPQMAATHGVANAVGFALLGVLGWSLVRRGPSAAGHGGDA